MTVVSTQPPTDTLYTAHLCTGHLLCASLFSTCTFIHTRTNIGTQQILPLCHPCLAGSKQVNSVQSLPVRLCQSLPIQPSSWISQATYIRKLRTSVFVWSLVFCWFWVVCVKDVSVVQTAKAAAASNKFLGRLSSLMSARVQTQQELHMTA